MDGLDHPKHHHHLSFKKGCFQFQIIFKAEHLQNSESLQMFKIEFLEHFQCFDCFYAFSSRLHCFTSTLSCTKGPLSEWSFFGFPGGRISGEFNTHTGGRNLVQFLHSMILIVSCKLYLSLLKGTNLLNSKFSIFDVCMVLIFAAEKKFLLGPVYIVRDKYWLSSTSWIYFDSLRAH